MRCGQCGAEVQPDTKFCGVCGQAQEQVRPRPARSFGIGVIVCLLLTLAAVGLWYYRGGSGRSGGSGVPARQAGALTTTGSTSASPPSSVTGAQQQLPELPSPRPTASRNSTSTEPIQRHTRASEPPPQPATPPAQPPVQPQSGRVETAIVESIRAPQATPVAPAPLVEDPERKPRQRLDVFRPETSERAQTVTPAVPAKPAYTGPSSGVIVWSGKLEKDELVTIESEHASMGQVRGKLPGVPVMLDINQREFALAELPSPSNGWSKLAIRSRKNRQTVITIHWTVLE